MSHADAHRAGTGRAWTRSASTCCCCRSAPTCPTSPGTRRCRSNGSRCSCCRVDGDAQLVVPRLEAPRVDAPARRVRDRAVGRDRRPGRARRAARVVGAGASRSATRRGRASCSTSRRRCRAHRLPHGLDGRPAALRTVKDAAEIDALARGAAHAVDTVAARHAHATRSGAAPNSTCTASSSSGCSCSGTSGRTSRSSQPPEDAASPHHEPSERVIGDGDVVLCDFGGTMDGYCSDITRMFVVGEPSTEVARRLRGARRRAGARGAGRDASGRRARRSTPRARDVIAAAGFGDRFVHRVGHGIGTEAHEDPYMVAGNDEPLVAGHAFSVEPGIYFAGRFGLRLEDIVVATDDGPAPAQRGAARPRRGRRVKLDAATFLLQWAIGGLLFLWVTTRRREVGLGYGWLLRMRVRPVRPRRGGRCSRARSNAAHPTANAVALVASRRRWWPPRAPPLVVSIVRRAGGVREQAANRERRRARVAAMVTAGADRLRARRPVAGDDPSRARRVPARARPRRAGRRAWSGLLAAAVLRRWPVPARGGAPRGRAPRSSVR